MKYAFGKNINGTTETGIVDLETAKVVCICPAENAKLILDALNSVQNLRNVLYQLLKVVTEVDSEGEKLASITEIVETYKLASETLQQFEQ